MKVSLAKDELNGSFFGTMLYDRPPFQAF